MFILLIVLGLPAVAPAQDHRATMHPTAPPARITATRDTVIIPMDFSTGPPTVQVYLNGSGPYPFVFDTGAPGTVVDAGLAGEVGFEVTGEVQVADPTQKNRLSAKQGNIDSLRVGGAILHDLQVSAVPLRDRFESKFLGVLGFPHFAEYLLEFDYPARRVRFYRGSLADGAPGVVSYRTPGSLIEFDVEVAGRIVPSHLDSGASGGFSVPSEVAARLPWSAKPESLRVAKSIANEATVYQGTLDGSVRFAGLSYERPLVDHMEILRDGNVGQKVLQDLVVVLDQKNKRLSFRRP